MRTFVVECYWPGVNEEKLVAFSQRAEAAASDRHGQGREIRFLGSILVPIDETVFWLFEGSEEDIRAVCEQAELPMERVLESLRMGEADEI